MDGSFSTPSQRPSRPPIGDFVTISKSTFIALISELPFHELQINSHYFTKEEDISTTISFVQGLGRALSNVHVTSSASKATSPKALFTRILKDHRDPSPTFPSEDDSPSKSRHELDLPPSTTAPEFIPSPSTNQIAPRCRFIDAEESEKWKGRQEIMKLAPKVDSSTLGILS